MLWLPWELSLFLDLPWFYKGRKGKTKNQVMLKDLILVRCSVPYKHTSMKKSLQSKPLNHNQLQGQGGTKQNTKKTHNLTFPFTLPILGDVVIFIHSLDGCNSAIAEKGVGGWWTWKLFYGICCIKTDSYLLLLPDPSATPSESTL